MPKICYEEKSFSPGKLASIEEANRIIVSYQAQGYDLTLRQLYYQFVSRDLIPNKQSEYKKLGGLISDARRAGLIDWNAIVDRTRSLESLSHWANPGDYIMPNGFRVDKWASQPYRVEVWIEKDALAGVFERVCQSLDVPYLSCRGYTSDSAIWGAAQRLARYAKNRYEVVILHFGDHDPSGIDMTRDIRDRLALLGGPDLEVRRLALNMDQVDEYSPPPNPAKDVDPRFKGYIERFGDESWELDALEPSVLSELVRSEVESLIDKDAWEEQESIEEEGIRKLEKIADKLRKGEDV